MIGCERARNVQRLAFVQCASSRCVWSLTMKIWECSPHVHHVTYRLRPSMWPSQSLRQIYHCLSAPASNRRLLLPDTSSYLERNPLHEMMMTAQPRSCAGLTSGVLPASKYFCTVILSADDLCPNSSHQIPSKAEALVDHQTFCPGNQSIVHCMINSSIACTHRGTLRSPQAAAPRSSREESQQVSFPEGSRCEPGSGWPTAHYFLTQCHAHVQVVAHV